MKKLFKVWKRLAHISISTVWSNKIDGATYLLGKIVRFVFFVGLIVALFSNSTTFVGYTKYELLLIFSTFNFADLLAQIFYRGVYYFPDEVLKGNFDYILHKPFSALVYSLARIDILDTIFIIPIIILIIYCMLHIASITFLGVIFYMLFLLFGLLITTSFHVLSVAFAIQSPDNFGFIWLYREVFGLARFPQEIFSGALQLFFTFIIPVFIIATYPVKVLVGKLSPEFIVLALVYGVVFFVISLWLWRISLKKYSSASS